MEGRLPSVSSSRSSSHNVGSRTCASASRTPIARRSASLKCRPPSAETPTVLAPRSASLKCRPPSAETPTVFAPRSASLKCRPPSAETPTVFAPRCIRPISRDGKPGHDAGRSGASTPQNSVPPATNGVERIPPVPPLHGLIHWSIQSQRIVQSKRSDNEVSPTSPETCQTVAPLPFPPPLPGRRIAPSRHGAASSARTGTRNESQDGEEFLALMNSARSACLEPCVPEPWPGSPCSPLTALVRRKFADRTTQATVHTVELKEANLQPTRTPTERDSDSDRDDSDGFLLTRPETLYASAAEGRSRSRGSEYSAWGSRESCAGSEGSSVPPVVRLLRPSSSRSTRELDAEEVALRSRKAAEFFREALRTNCKAKTSAEHASIVADARKNRATSESEAAKGFMHKKTSPTACAAARARSEPEVIDAVAAVVPAPQAVRPPLPSPPKSLPDAPKSLLEKFGYGVKPKDEQNLAPALEYVVPKKVNNMIGIQVGKNDLKERLAARRTLQFLEALGNM